jgi:hypothetical protein
MKRQGPHLSVRALLIVSRDAALAAASSIDDQPIADQPIDDPAEPG